MNPIDESVTVLVLDQSGYVEHSAFRKGQRADSVVLGGFSVAVAEIFDAR